jgi:hypothetical protein
MDYEGAFSFDFAKKRFFGFQRSRKCFILLFRMLVKGQELKVRKKVLSETKRRKKEYPHNPDTIFANSDHDILLETV